MDTADQMLKYYTARAATWRWPLNVFGNLIDIVCLNAFIISKQLGITDTSRREFLIELAAKLTNKAMMARGEPFSGVSDGIRAKIRRVQGEAEPQQGTHKRITCKRC